MADDAGAAEAGIVMLALKQQSAICHAGRDGLQLSIDTNHGTSPLRQVEDRCHALLCDANYFNRRNDSSGEDAARVKS